MYYEKEAITKQLYDWLLKNGYADANLIAKWKKQGYEKVCLIICNDLCLIKLTSNSFAVFAAFRRRKQTSTAHAFVESLRSSSKTIRRSSASAADAAAAPAVTKHYSL